MTMPANLKKRLITGSVMALAMTGILIGDDHFSSNAPFLITCIVLLQALAVFELTHILNPPKPNPFIVLITLIGMTLVAWLSALLIIAAPKTASSSHFAREAGIISSMILIAVMIEVFRYDATGNNTPRISNTLLLLVYLGLPSIFLVMIRALPHQSTFALAATIFVPKFGDIGAYFTGSLFGKHKMTPLLSPKKTWEGFAGGLVAAVLTAIAIDALAPEPLFKGGVLQAIAFGVIVGIAGVLGDLFESMLKRDGQKKDASQSLPGFGGILDVVDSVLFAAPVAYLFFIL